MFNRSLVIHQPPPRTEYVDRKIEITENRAPTDESVRLLSEMEKAAQDRIEKAVRLEASKFNCVIHTAHDLMSGDFVAVALFDLNGQRMRCEHRAPDFSRADHESGVAFAEGLVAEISKTIAREAIGELVKSMQGKIFNTGR